MTTGPAPASEAAIRPTKDAAAVRNENAKKTLGLAASNQTASGQIR